MMFSIIVKRKLFTKHFGSQWASCSFSPNEVVAALQPLTRRPRPRSRESWRWILFSNLDAAYFSDVFYRRCCLGKLEIPEHRGAHVVFESFERPRIGSHISLCIDVPASAPGRPDGAGHFLSQRSVIGFRRLSLRRDFARLARLQQTHKLKHIIQLTLDGHQKRKVSDWAVRSSQHEEIREVRNADGPVGFISISPGLIERPAAAARNDHRAKQFV